MKIIFATNNQNKVTELKAALPTAIELITLQEADIAIDIPEPHDTLEANAIEKATVIHKLTGTSCFSEDTGLEVKALNGAPGVRSARFAGETATAQQNIDALLGFLKSSADRSARFRTVICLILNGNQHLFEGICTGTILNAQTGSGGFGYDPVFVPDGAQKSFAQMSLPEKNSFSHRRKAADKLVAFLNGVALNS
ncbi:MAG TPA: RdgB/HAM1 family non-canonical purine NTP pyrophosphatase [Chitinophagaceae bacterium]|nr:RdgB/HAM1 family non-canonical purine NTP pyrophosphatase [Chitinophagaceae bacterium]